MIDPHPLPRKTAMKREEELTAALRLIAAPRDCGCSPVCQCNSESALRIEVDNLKDIAQAALLPTPNPKPEPVGWETDAEWDLEMRCCNITENTPFDEVSKLINDLWQQYCLAAEPKPEATEGVAHQAHHSKPVASQNTQIVEDKATEGGANEKGMGRTVYGWFVKDFADGWIFFDNEADAARQVEATGAMMLVGFHPASVGSPSERLAKWLEDGPKLAKAAGCHVGIKVSAALTAKQTDGGGE